MTILRLPTADRPLLSVVLVTYGGWDWPYRALEALASSTLAPFEAICVDNDSWDGTGELLEELVDGATIVRNRSNEGFAAAANRGAALARGELLCFLNPDCLVEPHWLRPLAEAVGREGVGAAIPRFLDPDGTVQEAGSVIDCQGWSEALGRGADPDDPAYAFPRVVDYASAACMVIPRETFQAVGGFDPAFFPAYCEDVDLCFRLREAGLATWYEPRSTVRHAGSVSTGRIARDRLIERNRRLLLDRWGDQLSDRPPLTELQERPHRLLALRDALAPDRLLAILPEPPPERARASLAGLAASPGVRVTALVPAPAQDLLEAGVEALPAPEEPEAWLAGRRFHYSAVWAADGALDDAVERWQPQALRLSEGALEAGPRRLLQALGGPSSPD